MSDIVERLRETETDCYTPPEIARECRKAADEIERLRGLLREYADVVRLIREGKPVPLAYLEDRIREALGE